MHLTSTLKRIRIILVGSDSVFSLEARIYHSICIVAFFALAYNVPFNYFVGLPRVAFVSLIALAGFAWLYYMSRVRKEFIYSVIGLGILGNIFFAVVYF
jgi:two-component system sensor histidine kinase/response regulator